MKSNHNEIEEIISQKKDYEVLFYSSNSRDQNNFIKPKDVIENFVKKNNDENKVNYETKLKQEDNLNIKLFKKIKPDFGLNKSLFKKFEKSLLNFLEYSTIGELSELGKRKEIYLRLFWMIVVFIGTCHFY
jgi:hypothetical protein